MWWPSFLRFLSTGTSSSFNSLRSSRWCATTSCRISSKVRYVFPSNPNFAGTWSRERPMGGGNTRSLSKNKWMMFVPLIINKFHTYIAHCAPIIHVENICVSAWCILSALLRYLKNMSIRTARWFYISTALQATLITLYIVITTPFNKLPSSTMPNIGRQFDKNNFQNSALATASKISSFRWAPLMNPFISSMLKSGFIYPSCYRTSPGTQTSMNITSNGSSDDISCSGAIVEWSMVFDRRQCMHTSNHCLTRKSIPGHQNLNTMNQKILSTPMCPYRGDKCHYSMTTRLGPRGLTLVLIYLV